MLITPGIDGSRRIRRRRRGSCRWGGVVFSSLVFMGQLLVAIGALQPNAFGFSVAVLGRFVYG